MEGSGSGSVPLTNRSGSESGRPKTYGSGPGTLSTAHTHRVDPTFQYISNPDPTLELKQVKQEGLLVLRSIATVYGFVY
jgi:hypothetical protein